MHTISHLTWHSLSWLVFQANPFLGSSHSLEIISPDWSVMLLAIMACRTQLQAKTLKFTDTSWLALSVQWSTNPKTQGLKFIRRAFSGVNLAFGMLTRECFLECTFNWLDYSTGIKDETQTHCFTGFSRMVSLVIPNVGFASLLTQSPHLILLHCLF